MQGFKLKTNISQIETTVNITNNQIKLPPLTLSSKRLLFDDSRQKNHELYQKKLTLLNLISNKQADEAAEVMKQVMQDLQYYDLEIFAKGLRLLGDMYYSGREFNQALNCYNQLRYVSDFLGNMRMKVESLLQIADLCKLLQDYFHCKFFLKKALQYVWYLGDVETESTIYDIFGVMYFIKGDSQKAKEFHDRAVNFIKESDDSASKRHGIDSVRSHLKKNNHRISIVDPIVLSKLGMIGEDYKEIKLITHLDYNKLLDLILSDDEFAIEMSTPNRPQQKLTINGELQNGQAVFESVRNLHERQKKRRFFEKKIPDLRISRTVLKFSIDEQLKMRADADKRKEKLEKFFKDSNKPKSFKTFQNALTKVNINHLSPNRNALGFKFCFKPMRKQILHLFQEIEQY
ncbi:hypothetical protein pb186bvf_020295 [Paramecium bursaria]